MEMQVDFGETCVSIPARNHGAPVVVPTDTLVLITHKPTVLQQDRGG